jgi:hypothetical protein
MRERAPTLRPRTHAAPLPAPFARALAELIASHGHDGAAARLHVSPALVDKLSSGGKAAPDSVRRMVEALARLGAPVPA